MKLLKIVIVMFSIIAILMSTGCTKNTVPMGDKSYTAVEDGTRETSKGAYKDANEDSNCVATGTADESADGAAQDYSSLFELNLYTDKTIYSTTEKIKIWATLKYIGKDNHIKIWHGDPYISFYISDGKDFDTGGFVHDILMSTDLEKGKLYHFDYTKNGGYSADGPKAEFWRGFYAEEDLYLPEGEYTVKVATAFTLTEKQEKNASNLSKELKITVNPAPPNTDANNSVSTGNNDSSIADNIGSSDDSNISKLSSCKSDLDLDGIQEEIYIRADKGSTYGKELVIRSGGRELGTYDMEDLKPWKVQTADVDGDGVREISVGVYKTARFHPVMAKRPFIYNWDKEGLSPKWLGSRLSHPFDDYIFCDIDGDDMEELIAIELLSNGRKIINSYKWKGFGFEGIGESVEFQDIMALQKQEPEKRGIQMVTADILKDDHWKNVNFSYQNGKLIGKV